MLPSSALNTMMPPRPSNLNRFGTLSLWFPMYTTSTSILRCLLGHLLFYNSRDSSSAVLFIPFALIDSFAAISLLLWATPSRQYTMNRFLSHHLTLFRFLSFLLNSFNTPTLRVTFGRASSTNYVGLVASPLTSFGASRETLPFQGLHDPIFVFINFHPPIYDYFQLNMHPCVHFLIRFHISQSLSETPK